MITKDQAMSLRHGQEIHCNVVRKCKCEIGPHGGIKQSFVRVRVSGQCKTWVTRPDEFSIPVKFGLYESGYLTQDNADSFHFPEECPANQ